MDEKQLQELLAQSVPNITAKLVELDRDTLVQLQAAEVASAAPRVTLQAAIDERLKALDDMDGGNPPPPNNSGDNASETAGAVAGKGDPAAPAAGKLLPSHWQHPDYAGALSGEQAAWRVANVKPAAAVRRK